MAVWQDYPLLEEVAFTRRRVSATVPLRVVRRGRREGRRNRNEHCCGPDGFTYEWTTLAFQQMRAGNTAVYAFVLAVVFVFLVLAAQYESLTLPLAVILIVPMSLIASITGVLLRGQDNNILLWGYGGAVPRKDWNELIKGDALALHADAEGRCIRNVYVRSLDWAEKRAGGSSISYVFDERPQRIAENSLLYEIFRSLHEDKSIEVRPESLKFDRAVTGFQVVHGPYQDARRHHPGIFRPATSSALRGWPDPQNWKESTASAG
jgi:hypothetical protein